jgi:hypothetical protein
MWTLEAFMGLCSLHLAQPFLILSPFQEVFDSEELWDFLGRSQQFPNVHHVHMAP